MPSQEFMLSFDAHDACSIGSYIENGYLVVDFRTVKKRAYIDNSLYQRVVVAKSKGATLTNDQIVVNGKYSFSANDFDANDKLVSKKKGRKMWDNLVALGFTTKKTI
jgi:hypothetical protein